MKHFAVSLSLLLIITNLSAQTADEIINKYFENTGGINNWRALNGMTMHSVVKDNDMEIPSTRIALKDGRILVKFELQDKEIVQIAYDGKETWGDNFMTMEAEKNDSLATRKMFWEARDFPHALLDYTDNDYAVEYLGKEQKNGKEYHKLKLIKNKEIIDKTEVVNSAFYYFNPENFRIEIRETEIQSGNLKGKLTTDTYGNYTKVGDIYFPFSISRSIADLKPTEVTITSIELNPVVNDADFIFPEKKK